MIKPQEKVVRGDKKFVINKDFFKKIPRIVFAKGTFLPQKRPSKFIFWSSQIHKQLNIQKLLKVAECLGLKE